MQTNNTADIKVTERTGEAFELSALLTVVGKKLVVGDDAPDFQLEFIDPSDSQLRVETLAETAGTVRLLNVVNSVDTPVCNIETKRWEKESANLPSDIRIITISMDLPFACDRYSKTEGISHHALSAHMSEKFGKDYGVLIKEWRLLQRAVFVIDKNDKIVHAEYVADQMTEPDYNAALEAARKSV